jgi:hypothetical protein
MTAAAAEAGDRRLCFLAALTVATMFLFAGWRSLSNSLWWGAVDRVAFRAVVYTAFACAFALVVAASFLLLLLASRGSFRFHRFRSVFGTLLLGTLAMNCVRQAKGLGLGEVAAVLQQPLALCSLLFLVFSSSVLAIRWPLATWRMLIATLAALSPFSAIQAATLWFIESRFESSLVTPPSLGTAITTDARVIIVVLDELDAKELQHNLPLLPGFSSLLNTSTSFSSVLAPSERTLTSVPAMFTARHVDSVATDGSFRLWIRHQQASVAFLSSNSLFADAALLGRNSRVAGWYLPYCSRSLSLPVEDCANFANWSVPTDLLSGITYFLGAGWGSWSLSPNRTRLFAQMRTELERFLNRANHFALERDAGLVFLHYPVPHLPSRFDRATGNLRLRASYASDEQQYLDNLFLADRILSKLLADLEAKHLLDAGWLVVTGDHGFRSRKPFENHIPLIVRAPGGKLVGVDTTSASPMCLRRFVRSVFQQTERSPSEHLRALRYADTTRLSPCL